VVTDPALAKEFYEKAGSEDKTYKLYEDQMHAIFVEPKKDEVFKDVFEWLDNHSEDKSDSVDHV